MDTIEERAQMCVDKIGILGAYQGYINGATEQKKIDIDKACEWLKLNGDKYIIIEDGQLRLKRSIRTDLRKAMEE